MSKTKPKPSRYGVAMVFDCFPIYYLLIITIPDFKFLALPNPTFLGFNYLPINY